MFSFITLSALIVIAGATPDLLPHEILPKTIYPHEISQTIVDSQPIIKTVIEPHHVEFKEPFVTKVGEHIEKIPSAISHQSSTVVHRGADFVTPILEKGLKTYTAPIVKSIESPPFVEEHFKILRHPFEYRSVRYPFDYRNVRYPLEYKDVHYPLEYPGVRYPFSYAGVRFPYSFDHFKTFSTPLRTVRY